MATFKKGDKVRIIGNGSGNGNTTRHYHRIGDIGVVEHEGSYEGVSRTWVKVGDIPQMIDNVHLELVEEEKPVSNFKVGDEVEVINGPFEGHSGVLKEHPLGEFSFLPDHKNVRMFVLDNNGYYKHEKSTFSLGVYDYDLKLKEKETTVSNLAFTATANSISVYLSGKMFNVTSNDPAFAELKEELKKPVHDIDAIGDMLDKPKYISRISEGAVTVEEGRVLYKGEPVHSTLTRKLLDMAAEGFDIKPWARFLDNLMTNPSYRSREALYDFLDNFATPITDDGCFLAFKRVRGNFFDIHSNSMDNSPGNVVKMDRYGVDDDNDRTCSAGLHACASNYLGNFYASTPGYKVVVVKINPRDVVSVPRDYQFSKMRVCEYLVVAEAEEKDVHELSTAQATTWDRDNQVQSWEDMIDGSWLDDYPYDDSYDDSYSSY